MKFTKEYSKLKFEYFTTIRKNTGFYRVYGVYKIVTPEQVFVAKIISARPMKKEWIGDDIAFKDADTTAGDLVSQLERWYGKDFDDFVLLTLKRVE